MKDKNLTKLLEIINDELMFTCQKLCNPSSNKNIVYCFPPRFSDILQQFVNKIFDSSKLSIETMVKLPLEELEILTKRYMTWEKPEDSE